MTKTRDDADGVDPNSIQEDVKTRQLGTQASEPGTEAPFASATTIGDYRIIRKIGEGGMGVVYEAEQKNPHRLVALKVIRGGLHTDDYHVKMFEREIEALARLKHPGIASIYESGRSDDGTVFFAMELVNGVPLSDFVERRRNLSGDATPDVKSQLALFAQIGDVISHAHQRGVIHRDLKPQNILVTDDGDLGSLSGDRVGVKILDFGLARINDPDFRGNTGVSQIGQIKGTLLYMSPEQVRGRSDEIDVRSDVYALGVMLYEMLTGRVPYDLSQASLPEAMRIICEEPPMPLTRALTLAGSRTGRIDRDVETIVLKALEKEPDRRYQSVAAMLDDVERYLTNQPITARPPSAFYQFRKLVERHKVAFAALATIFLLVAGFGVVMAAQSVRIANERDKAEQARADAEEQKAQAEESRNDALAARNEEAKQRQIAVDNLTRAETAQNAEAEQRKIAEDNLREAQEQTAIAKTKKREAEIASKQRSLAEERAVLRQKEAENQAEANRRQLYVSQMNLAQEAWNQGNILEMQELLENQVPRPPQTDLRGFEWYYLWRLAHEDMWTARLPGLPGSVMTSRDGKKVIANSAELDEASSPPKSTNRIIILDALTGTEIGRVEGRFAFGISTDGKNLVVSDGDLNRNDGRIFLLDVDTKEIKPTPVACCSILSVNLSEDGRLFVARPDGAAEIWDLFTGSVIFKLQNVKKELVIQTRLAPDGRTLARVSVDATEGSQIVLSDIASGREIARLRDENRRGLSLPMPDMDFFSLAFSSDGKLFATGGPAVKLWETATHKVIAVLTDGEDNLMDTTNEMVFSPDGKFLAAARGRAVEIFDVQTKRRISTVRLGERVMSLCFSPDGSRLSTSSQDNRIRQWEIVRSRTLDLEGQSGAALSPDKSQLATTNKVGDLTLRRFERLETRATFASKDLDIGKVLLPRASGSRDPAIGRQGSSFPRFSSDGQIVGVERSSSAGLHVEFFDVRNLVRIAITSNDIMDWSFVSESPYAVTVDRSGTVAKWDLSNRKMIASFAAFSSSIEQRSAYSPRVNFSPDGRMLAVMVDEKNLSVVRLMDSFSGRDLLPPFKENSLMDIFFTEDSRILVLRRFFSVRFLNVLTGREPIPPVPTAPSEVDFGNRLVSSPDGRWIAGSIGKKVRLFERDFRKEIGLLTGHREVIVSIAFSGDGKRLATGSADRTVKIWDLNERKIVATLNAGIARRLLFSADGRSLVTLGENQVQIWRGATDEEVAKQRGK